MLPRLTSFFSFFTGRYAPAFLTLIVLAGVFYFYFNVVVSRNEANLKERNFRGLHRMSANTARKLNSYSFQNAANFLRVLDSFNRTMQRGHMNNQFGLEPLDNNLNDPADSFFVRFDREWRLVWRIKQQLVASSVEKFMDPLLRRDLFPKYLLAIGDTILFDELNMTTQSLSDYLPGETARDSVRKGNVIQTGEVRQVEIGGREYKLFLLPFIVNGQYKFTLGGYMTREDYRNEERYIPTYAILWLVIGIILVLLMFPLLKVFLMHRSEQLLARNAISSLASIHIIGSILVLISINSYVYFAMIIASVNNNLSSLASDIQHCFTTEVNAALQEIDAAKESLPKYPYDRSRLLADYRITGSMPAEGNADYRPGSFYPYFQHIAWTDTNGQQQVRWTRDRFVPAKIDVSDRDYFREVQEGRAWRRPDGRNYYLTSISSWVADEKVGIISTPAADDTIIQSVRRDIAIMTISGPMRSMFSPILPQGFGFCVIRENGDVLFHIDPKRNLNENLVEECGNNNILESLLRTHSSGLFGSRYSGSTQRFYVKPIPGMPYFIVTFRDMKTIWSEDLDVICACSVLTLMNLAIILLAVLLIRVAGYRSSLLKNQSIAFTWLRPKRTLKHAYHNTTFFYWYSMILQAAFYLLYKGKDQLCLLGICFAYAFILISYAYYQFTTPSVPQTALERRSLFTPENRRPMYVLIAVYLVSSVIFLLNLSSGYGSFLFSQAALLGVLPLGRLINQRANLRRLDRKGYRWWYILALFSFIAATAIIPSMIFYFLSFKQERLLSLKHNQLAFVGQLLQKPKDEFAGKKDSIGISFATPFYFRSFADSIKLCNNMPESGDTSRNNFETLYKIIKPAFSEYSRQMEQLKGSTARTNDFIWIDSAKANQLQLHYRVNRNGTILDSSWGLSIYSSNMYRLPRTLETIRRDWMSALLLFAVLCSLLITFGFLLRALIRRVFFTGFENIGKPGETDLNFARSLPADEHIFINGPVNSGKHRTVLQVYQNEPVRIHELDIANLPKLQATGMLESVEKSVNDAIEKEASATRQIVLLKHFEMYMDDPQLNEQKLLLLEWLLSKKKIQIIILSSCSYDKMPKTGPPVKADSEVPQDFSDRWSNVMNKFYSLYHHWKRPEERKADREKPFSAELLSYCMLRLRDQTNRFQLMPEELLEVKACLKKYAVIFLRNIDKECGHSDFLWSLRDSLYRHLLDPRNDCFRFDFQYNKRSHMCRVIRRHFNTLFEQMCLKIQSLAKNYYLSTWESMSAEEQRTLYDIALDEMVNAGNRDVARRLAELGLVVPVEHSSCYEVMNKSFRNFIFTQLDSKEVTRFTREAAEKGTWSSFQLPVIIVVIALGIFLFITQRDAFSNLLTYLGAAVGGIAALLKILGMIPSSKG